MNSTSERLPKKQCTPVSRTQAESESSLRPRTRKLSFLSRGPALISPPVSPETPLNHEHKVVEREQRNSHDLLLYSDDLIAENVDTDLFMSRPDEIILPLGASRDGGNAARSLPRRRNLPGPYYKARTGSLYNRYSSQYLKLLRNEWAPGAHGIQKMPAEAGSSEPIKREVSSASYERSRKSDKPRQPQKSRHSQQLQQSRKIQQVPKIKDLQKTLSKPSTSSARRKLAAARPIQPLPCAHVTDVKPGKKRVEDTDFEALLDFCPPLSTLTNVRALRADWRGGPVDLSHDPHRACLDEREINLASTLRLSCATYLCSKRRIFIRLVESFRTNREFRKTDAQQACKIDVNKASKLWSAFENGGWFRRELFEHVL